MAESTRPDPVNEVTPNPTDELLSMVEPSQATQFTAGPLVRPQPDYQMPNAPEIPAATGVSPSIADQFRKIASNANALAASNPAAAAAPGGWARTLLGGAMTTLAGGGLNLGSPQPGPLQSTGIGGVQNALNARRQQVQEYQQRQQELKQREFENKMKTNEDTRAQQLHDMQVKLYQIQTEKAKSAMDEDTQNRFMENVVKPKMQNELAQGVRPEDMTTVVGQEGLEKLAKLHSTADDPSGHKWLAGQDVIPSRYVDDIGPDGTKTGRSQEFVVGQYPDARKSTQGEVDDYKTYLGKNLSVDDPEMDPRQRALMNQQVITAKAHEVFNDKLGVEMGMSQDQMKSLHDKADYQAASTAFAPWVIADNGDVKQALIDVATHAQNATNPPEGYTPTAEDKKAAEMFGTIQKAYGAELIKNAISEFDKEQLEKIKANAAAAKNMPLQIEGDTSLRGQAYINSLPVGRRDLIQQITSGQVGAVSPRLLSGKDGQLLMAEAAHADPDLDTNQIGGYPALIKAFNTGKEAQQIKAINTVVPHLDDLYAAIENGIGTTLPGLSWIERKFGNQAAIDVNTLREIATQEEAKAYATGAVTDQEHKAFADQLQDFKTAPELKGTIYSLLTALNRQVNSLENQWQQGLPSPHWNPKRVIVDPDAKAAFDDVISRHSGGAATRKPGGTQQQGFTMMAPDGKTPLTFPNQKAMDDFKAAHGIK